jgi:tetratricopeptide (TPR) repeat protein
MTSRDSSTAARKPAARRARRDRSVDHRPPDLRGGLAGRSVALAGQLQSLSRASFEELITQHGGKLTTYIGAGTSFVVIGRGTLPLDASGTLSALLREARVLKLREHASLQILTEEQFLASLGVVPAERQDELYSTTTLTRLLDVPRYRLKHWIAAGLIQPARTEHGVWYFDFRQVSAAKMLCELVAGGVSVAMIRRNLERLKAWMPDVREPLRQLAMLQENGRLLVRLDCGDLVEADGQFQLDFDAPASAPVSSPPVMRIVPGPRTAAQWFEQGVEQENEGVLAEAEESYRQALRLGGFDADVIFNLANVLRRLGKREQAEERYWQVLEVEPRRADAWNNLGLLLDETGRREEAAAAFRKALDGEPESALMRCNLADTLEELGRAAEALPHWEAYLRLDPQGPWADHARGRLSQR